MNIELAISKLGINKEATALIAQMKAVLTTPELINEYIERVQNKHQTREISNLRVLYIMRSELVDKSSITLGELLNLYLENPVEALILYFKENIVLEQVNRLNKWGIDIIDVIKIAEKNKGIRFDRAVMQLN